MLHAHKYCILISFLLFFCLTPANLNGRESQGQKLQSTAAPGRQSAALYSSMPEPGKKVPIGNGYYLLYGFDKKPKLGTVIMKVEIYSAGGKKDTSFEVKADAGMPSMKGAHETGDRPFKLSKKGDYLLPINIVMPGDWEIRLSVIKAGKAFFRGRYNFDV